MKTSQELINNAFSRIKSAHSSLDYLINSTSLTWSEIYQVTRILISARKPSEELITELQNPLRSLSDKVNQELGKEIAILDLFEQITTISAQFHNVCGTFFDNNKDRIFQKRMVGTDFIIEETFFLPSDYQQIINLAVILRDQLSVFL